MKYTFHPAALIEYSEAVQFYAGNKIELAILQSLCNLYRLYFQEHLSD